VTREPGVRFRRWALISRGASIQGQPAAAALPLPPDAHALHWADGLRPQGAETLAAGRHPHFGR
jgi:hypothetical protein